MHLCQCGSPLLVRYDLQQVRASFEREALQPRSHNLWRYEELLPINDLEGVVSLGENMTPLLALENLGAGAGASPPLSEGRGCPSDRDLQGPEVRLSVSPRRRNWEYAFSRCPPTVTPGGAWAAYCAAAGIQAVIVMPESAPVMNWKECALAGASLYLVKGLISDAGKIVARAISDYGWYDASTLKEPYRIEGKKTMGLELIEQLGWRVPDVILYPTGGGVGIIGIFKVIKELQEIGQLNGRLPRMVAVQSTGCAPIVKAWEQGKLESEFWENAHTAAFGITVPKALGDFLVLEAIYETEGCAIAVDDKEILQAQRQLASRQGLLVCPEGAATLCAAATLAQKGWIKEEDEVVLFNTGTGLKYPETVEVEPEVLAPEDTLPG